MADSYSLKAVLSAVDKISPVLKTVEAGAKAARKYLGDVGKSINGLTSKFGVPMGILSTIAAGFGVAAIKKAVVGFTELSDAILAGALKAGMSNAEFQRMKYVVERAGLPVEAMQASLGKLNKNLGDAAQGKNDGLVDLLKRLHIPLRDARGQMRNAADMLPQLAEAFVKNKDPIKQAAIGTALFGKAYQEMLPFLNEGGAGIEQSLARFKKLKGVMPDADLAAGKAFGETLGDLSFILKGFQGTIAKDLVPVLDPMVESFIQWAAVNKKLVGSEVKKVVQDLVGALKQVDWAAFVQSIRKTVAAIGSGIDKVGGLKNALIVLAIIMNAQTIAAIAGMAGALLRLGWVAGVATFGKVGLLATANVWLGASFVWLRAQALAAIVALRIGGVAALWSGLGVAVSGAGAAVAALGGYLLSAARAALVFGRALLLSPLGIVLAVAAAAWLLYENWNAVSRVVGQAWSAMAADAAKAWVAISGFAGKTWDTVAAGAGKALAWIGTAHADLVGGLVDGMEWVATTARQAFDAAAAAVGAAWDTVRGWFGGFFDWLDARWRDVLAWVAPFGRLAQSLIADWEPLKAWFSSLFVWLGEKFGWATTLAGGIGRAVAGVFGAGSPAASSVGSAAALGAPVPAAAAPGALGSGSFNLNAPATASLNGKVEINFKNAPPGMQVEQARADAPRVALNTSVGYRTLGTDFAF